MSGDAWGGAWGCAWGGAWGAVCDADMGAGHGSGRDYSRPWEDFPHLRRDEDKSPAIARKLRKIAAQQVARPVENRKAQAASAVADVAPAYASAWLAYYELAYAKALDDALMIEMARHQALLDVWDDDAMALLLLEC